MLECDVFIVGMIGVVFVCFMVEFNGLLLCQVFECVYEVFFYVGFGEVCYCKVELYLFGMKQFVKLVQVIVYGLKLFFFDELMNGFDLLVCVCMLCLICEICDSGFVKIFILLYLLCDVEECCEEVFVFKDGCIVIYCNFEEECWVNCKFLEIEMQGEVVDYQLDFFEEFCCCGCEVVIQNCCCMKVVLFEGVEICNIYEIVVVQDIQICKFDYKWDLFEDIFLKVMEGDD